MGSRLKIAFVATAALAVFAPPVASGGGSDDPDGVDGIVHIRNKPPYFHGNIGAENEICSSPRTIKLFQRKDGDRILRGTTVSDIEDEGVKASWEIIVQGPRLGRYFATSPRQTMENGGFPVDCARAKSRTITVDGDS